jgi:hypothetical protein
MQESIQRGFRLGIILFGLFVLSASAIYLLGGAAGTDGAGQLLLALCLGPLLGSLVFGGWWLRQRSLDSSEV